MLIIDAEIEGRIVDLRIERGRVAAIGPTLRRGHEQAVLDAGGGAVIPGLHDHHIHLAALARALESVPCGAPEVGSEEELIDRLRTAAASTAEDGWIRGTGYHESIAGEIDRCWLDRHVPHRATRIQHRSGRLWIMNSRALEMLGQPAAEETQDTPLELLHDRPTGRLYDADAWLRDRLRSQYPSLRRASSLLARFGVTGVTDATPSNTVREYAYMADAQARGELLQEVLVMGDASLDGVKDGPALRRGATKFHLHEAALPEWATLCSQIRRSHAAKRPVAFHCVTSAELVFALAALAACGGYPGDRVEHASVVPPDVLPLLANQGVPVVSQPNFIFERGDTYLVEVPEFEHSWLYRAQGLLQAGIPLAGGTDAPFGHANPWLAMQAAVERRSRSGRVLGRSETLSPEQALLLFSTPAEAPGGPARRVVIGAAADLCVLDRSLSEARRDLRAVQVQATLRRGEFLWCNGGASSRVTAPSDQ